MFFELTCLTQLSDDLFDKCRCDGQVEKAIDRRPLALADVLDPPAQRAVGEVEVVVRAMMAGIDAARPGVCTRLLP